MSTFPPGIGVILVDHGSERCEANDLLVEVVEQFRAATGAKIVEPAHMEQAAPSIADAFARCVSQGARQIVIHPYFLAPGRHSTTDIPHLAGEAARDHPEIEYTVTEPLGLDARMSEVVLRRIEEALASKPRTAE